MSVGIIGGNGAGKTTLFRMILGREQADSGSINVGDTVRSRNMRWSQSSLLTIRCDIDPLWSVMLSVVGVLRRWCPCGWSRTVTSPQTSRFCTCACIFGFDCMFNSVTHSLNACHSVIRPTQWHRKPLSLCGLAMLQDSI